MAFFSMAIPWNEGEKTMHKLLHVPDDDNPTASGLTSQASSMLQRAPLLAIGTLDAQNRPWTTLWGGNPGFSENIGGPFIGTRTIVDGSNDPVVQALFGDAKKGQTIQGNEKMVSGLAIDLMTRKRVKIFGTLLAASLDEVDVVLERIANETEGLPLTQTRVQLVTSIQQSLGNCPKYLNQYTLQPALVNSRLISQSSCLSPEARTLISEADMFFLSSSTASDMDTNHRGGPPGFVRILSDTEIVYPEYSGNRLYQSLGNLQMNSQIGITFPDYSTGNVVYITGTAEILVLDAAVQLLPGSNLAVKITITEARFVHSGLPFRGVRGSPSPYNPLVRTLVSEGNVKAALTITRKSAKLVKRTKITPTISRFKFSVPEGISYHPGQWVAFDFSKEMDLGYSHMRDDDPTSLNDDFVRTFTISSAPSIGNTGAVETEFEITIRKVGPVTRFLFGVDDGRGFDVPIIGVGGDFRIDKDDEKRIGFVAGGVGVTPLLGQLPSLGVDSSLSLGLYWSILAVDIDLVVEILEQYPQIAKSTKVFLTGEDVPVGIDEKIEHLRKGGTVVRRRRMAKDDLMKCNEEQCGTWYICAAKPFRRVVEEWLEGNKVVYEDFEF